MIANSTMFCLTHKSYMVLDTLTETSLINMMSGALDPSGGKIYIGGVDLASDPHTALQMIGLCPQFDVLFDQLTGA